MRRPSPALVLSCIAVFLSAAGGAVAAGQINGKQIKDGSITGKDIRNDSLTGTDIKGDLRGPEGPRGPQGPAGPQGPGGGPVGSTGGVAVSYRLREATIPPDGFQPVYAICPAGQVPTGGSYGAQQNLRVLDDRFGDSTPGNPDSWMASVENPTETPLGITVFVACITPSSVSPF
jgi:hypothetical protein